MDRSMIDIAAELLALSPLLETSRENDPKRAFENLGLFKDLPAVVNSSLGPVHVPAPPMAKAPVAAAPSAPPRYRPAPNPLHEALRARAAQRAAAFSSSRILKPKPLP